MGRNWEKLAMLKIKEDKMQELDLVKQENNNLKQELADLQHRLKVSEISLEKACKQLQDNYCMNCDNETNCSRVEMCEMSLGIYLPSDFKEQAEKEIKGE